MSLMDQIKAIVTESQLFHLQDELEDLDAPLFMDSMTTFILISRLEETFGISIDYRQMDLEHLQSLRSIERYVASLREGVTA